MTSKATKQRIMQLRAGLGLPVDRPIPSDSKAAGALVVKLSAACEEKGIAVPKLDPRAAGLPGDFHVNMTANRFCEMGRRCYGVGWKAALARRFKRSWPWIHNISEGNIPVPEEVALALILMGQDETYR